jgi:hypothetical protein
MPGLPLALRRNLARGMNRYQAAAIGSRTMLRKPTGANATAASRTIGTTNSAVTYEAPLWRGASGNNWRVAHVVAGASTPLSVVVSGKDVTVNVATNGSSAATSTAAQVAAAVNANTALRDSGFTATAGGTGAGVVVAGAIANLTGGTGGA